MFANMNASAQYCLLSARCITYIKLSKGVYF